MIPTMAGSRTYVGPAYYYSQQPVTQRAHELMMMDQQIELERLKALMAGRIGPFIPDTNIDLSLRG